MLGGRFRGCVLIPILALLCACSVTPGATSSPSLSLPTIVARPSPLPSPLPSPTATAVPIPPLPEPLQRIVDLTNQARAEAGCPAVSLHPQLTLSAEQHSQSMGQEDFFAHTDPDGSTPIDRVQATGYAFRLVAENIAAGYTLPEAVVESWMESEKHRRNIVNCEFEHIGVGHVYLEEDPGHEQWHHYWTQVLGAPQ